MKSFITKLITICVIITLALSVFEVLSYSDNYSVPIARMTDSETYLTHMDGPDWIVPLIEKVRTQDDSHVLLIGDSVCRQMFMDLTDINDETCIAPGIAAFTMAGQYVLTRLYLENHPDATDVYLLMVPMDDISNDFNIEYGYQYVIMPLVETDTLNMLDEETINELKDIYGEWFMDPGVVRKIDNSGLNRKLYINYIKDHKQLEHIESAEDTVYVKYLKRIREICDDRSVRLHFMSCPVPDMDAYHEIVEVKAPEYFAEAGLDELFPDYLGSVRYYPEERFADGVHFGGIYDSQSEYNKVIREMYGSSGLLEYVDLGD